LAILAGAVAASLLPIPVGASIVTCFVFWRLSWKKIGGCTGDVLGATIEVGEIAFLLALTGEAKYGLFVGGFFPLAHLLGFEAV
jgi:cobalamin synthase